MFSGNFSDLYDSSNYESITVKVEHPEYGLTDASSTTNVPLNNMRLQNTDVIANFDHYVEPQYRNEIYQKMNHFMGDDSMIDFIETSLDKFFVGYSKENMSRDDKRLSNLTEKRIYRKNETEEQRGRRLEMARLYIKRKRDSESIEQRCERLKKQRERIRAIRQALRQNSELYALRKKIEAERMKMRRANETPSQRMKRLEKSRLYSKKRREVNASKLPENETNSELIKQEINDNSNDNRNGHVTYTDLENICNESESPLPVQMLPCSVINN